MFAKENCEIAQTVGLREGIGSLAVADKRGPASEGESAGGSPDIKSVAPVIA